eukprot:g4979.t1
MDAQAAQLTQLRLAVRRAEGFVGTKIDVVGVGLIVISIVILAWRHPIFVVLLFGVALLGVKVLCQVQERGLLGLVFDPEKTGELALGEMAKQSIYDTVVIGSLERLRMFKKLARVGLLIANQNLTREEINYIVQNDQEYLDLFRQVVGKPLVHYLPGAWHGDDNSDVDKDDVHRGDEDTTAAGEDDSASSPSVSNASFSPGGGGRDELLMSAADDEKNSSASSEDELIPLPEIVARVVNAAVGFYTSSFMSSEYVTTREWERHFKLDEGQKFMLRRDTHTLEESPRRRQENRDTLLRGSDNEGVGIEQNNGRPPINRDSMLRLATHATRPLGSPARFMFSSILEHTPLPEMISEEERKKAVEVGAKFLQRRIREVEDVKTLVARKQAEANARNTRTKNLLDANFDISVFFWMRMHTWYKRYLERHVFQAVQLLSGFGIAYALKGIVHEKGKTSPVLIQTRAAITRTSEMLWMTPAIWTYAGVGGLCGYFLWEARRKLDGIRDNGGRSGDSVLLSPGD